jgi:Flp pilus assembly protein TadG
MLRKRNTHHNLSRRSRGQSLVEFALVLPLLLVLVISAIEIGRLFFTKIVITNAAREAAYYYATNPSRHDSATLQTRAAQVAQTEAANSGVNTVSMAVPTIIDYGAYRSVKITVSTTVTDLLILGFGANFLSVSATNHAAFPLSSTVEMMIQ